MLTIDPSLAAAIASAVAAVASAIAAGFAVRGAAQAAHRSAYRELRTTAHSLATELVSVRAMSKQICLEIDTFNAFVGGSGGSAEAELRARLDATLESLEPIQSASEMFSKDIQAIRRATTSQLVDILATFEEHLISVRAMRERFIHQLDTLITQNQAYRERRTGKPA